MNDNYQLGPIAISKSFIHQPLFLPALVGVILIASLFAASKAGWLSFSPKAPEPTIMAQVFPLNQQLSRPVLYSSGTTIYRTTGQNEEKMFEVGSEVLSLVLSSNGANLAATYKHPSGGSNAAGYPNTSLIFYDMNTRRSLPIIAQQNTTVRYPQWSDDGRYLSFWVNEGEEAFIYDTSRRKASYSVKREGSTAVSPISFLPGGNGIIYVKNGTLYSAAVDGTRPIALAEQVAATKLVNTSTVATPPLVTPNGAHLAYYTLSGELKVVNTASRETKAVDSNVVSLGFLSNDQLLYMKPTTDAKKNPTVFSFSLADSKSSKMMNRASFLNKGAQPQAAVLLSSQNKWYLPSVYPNVGPQLLTSENQVEQDCSEAAFSYLYNNSSDDTRLAQTSQVVSADGKYLLGLSNSSLAVLDVASCQPYIIAQTKPTAMIWTP
jgi:dipeptidyl aminopeptidase/acylaminoacyl peptidase